MCAICDELERETNTPKPLRDLAAQCMARFITASLSVDERQEGRDRLWYGCAIALTALARTDDPTCLVALKTRGGN